jgi:transposase-like protein
VISLLLDAHERRRGRPRASDDPAQRQRHVECAALMASGRLPVARIARKLGISRATAYNWRDATRDYDEADTLALRRLYGRDSA